MVLGSGNDAEILQKLINHFDDSEIDFFIHWDQKYRLPNLKSQKSQIKFVPRIKVYWGTSTLVYAEKRLLECVYNSHKEYNYVHLISSTDIPLMTRQYFKKFFNKELYLGFVPVNKKDIQRLSFYYPIDHLNIRNSGFFIGIIKVLNIIFHINRLKDKNIVPMKGSQWFSIQGKFLPIILKYNNMDIFKHSFLSDETYLQTILSNYRPSQLIDDNEMAARYIDWNRGTPYTFTEKDIPELKQVINTKFAFARKVRDASLIDKLFISDK